MGKVLVGCRGEWVGAGSDTRPYFTDMFLPGNGDPYTKIGSTKGPSQVLDRLRRLDLLMNPHGTAPLSFGGITDHDLSRGLVIGNLQVMSFIA